jgi:hypothetical protein
MPMQKLLFSMLAFLALASCATSPTPEAQTAYTKSLQETIAKAYASDEQIDKVITAQYGALEPAKIVVVRENFKQILVHPNFVPQLARISFPIAKRQMSPDELRDAVLLVYGRLQVQGARRIPVDTMQTILLSLADLGDRIGVEKCKAMYIGQAFRFGESDYALERNYLATVPIGEFISIASAYRDAVIAELSGTPPTALPKINERLQKRAQNSHITHTFRRLTGIMNEEMVKRVVTDPNTAPAADVCTFTNASIRALADLPEPYRSWQVITLVEDLQD